MKFYQDDRKQSFIDLFPMDHGQINISYIPANGSISAWHAHEYECFWFPIKGFFKVGVAKPIDLGMTVSECMKEKSKTCNMYKSWLDYYDMTFHTLSDKDPGILKLPHRSYHGYKNIGNEEAILLYWLDKKWTPDDDFKLEPGSFGENWEIESK